MLGNKRINSTLLTLMIIFSFTIPTLASTSPTIIRLAGIDRYATAAAIANSGWKQSDYAVLAYGENYPDALAAAPLASKYNAPILLTNGNNLPAITKQTLIDLQVKIIFIIGGTGVIAKSVESELQSIGIKEINIDRIAGQDRYETAIKVAKHITFPLVYPYPYMLFVVSGEDYPDALSIAPIAALKQVPIILVPKDIMPDCVKDYIMSVRMTTFKTYIVGDSDIIDDSVCNQFYSPERIGGADKYERNIAINQKFNDYFKSDSVCLATGENFADALTGSVYATKKQDPIILVKDAPQDVTKNYYQERLKNIDTISLFGGTAVVPDGLIQELGRLSTTLFKDNNLEKIVRQTINKKDGEITVEDVKSIDRLNANDSQIRDLSGIENCSNLSELYLKNNQISNIDALKGLENLTKLYLDNNQISDSNTQKNALNQTRDSTPKNTLNHIILMNPFLKELSVDGNHMYVDRLIMLELEQRKSRNNTTLIDNINISVNQNDSYSLPLTVYAKLYQGVPGRNVAVKWNTSTVDTSKVGTYNFLGTVAGYNRDVTLSVEVLANVH